MTTTKQICTLGFALGVDAAWSQREHANAMGSLRPDPESGYRPQA